MRKVIFLDRDGVVNKEREDYTFLPEDFILLDDVLESLLIWSQKGYEFIIISNQGGIGKGIYTSEQVDRLNEILLDRMRKKNLELLSFLYCPHHPEFTGKCLCRKPDSLLFEKSIAKYSIDITKSFMIGDKERDIIAAEKVGIKSFLVEANSSLKKFLSLFP